MSKNRLNLIKLFSFLFVVCIGFAITSIPTKAQNQSAEFSMSQSACIGTSKNGENEELIGLQFTSTVNEAWLTENSAETYTFGTLIYPTAKASSFDYRKTLFENLDLVDAVNIVHVDNQSVTAGKTFNASIVFDENVVREKIASKNLEVTDELVNSVLKKLYNKDFTARSYAIVNGETVYANTYSTSMYKVAATTYAKGESENNQNDKDLALNYFTLASVQDVSLNFYDGVLGIENFTATQNAVVLSGNSALEKGVDYTVDENGKIVFTVDYSKIGVKETFFVIDNGVLVVAKATHGGDVKSVSQALKVNSNEEVIIRGYYVGVVNLDVKSRDADNNYTKTQLLIKDKDSDSIIGVRKNFAKYVASNPKWTYTKQYTYGDEVLIKGTVCEDAVTINQNYIEFGDNNPANADTVISSGNIVNYSFDKAVTLSSSEVWESTFTTDIKPMTIVRFKGDVFGARFYGDSSTKASRNATRTNMLHYKSESEITKFGDIKISKLYVSLLDNVLNANVGSSWETKIPYGGAAADSWANTPKETLEVDFYAMYVGSNSARWELVILQEWWLDVDAHTCDYSKLNYDMSNHWYECVCGKTSGKEAHTGGTATQTSRAVCSKCSQEYGVVSTDSHVFSQKVVDIKYLKSPATCENKAKYYYSCECGEKGTDYFEYGEELGHAYGEAVSDGNGNHVQICLNDGSHVLTTKCTGEIPICVEQAVCTVCSGLYSGASSHDIDSNNFCRNCYSVFADDMTASVVELGIPTNLSYSEGDIRNSAWDTYYYNGKIYRGSGTIDKYSPSPIWAYDVENARWYKEFVTDDAAIHRFVEIDGKLVVPGADPVGETESWNWGNYYELGEDGWRKDNSVPNGVHMFDVIEFEGKIFYGLGVNYGKSPLNYTENGVDYTSVDFYDKDGVKLDFSQSAQGLTGVRVYELFIYKEELYAYIIYKGEYGIYKYDGTNMVCVNAEAPYGQYSNNENTWCNDFEVDGTYYLIVGVVYAVSDFADVGGFEKYTLPNDEVVTDAVCKDGKYYLLTHEKTAVNDKYKTRIYVSENMQKDSFTEVVSFEYEIPPLTFDKVGDDFYVSMGGYKYTSSTKNGILLKVSKDSAE